ncbi:491_t:CDS:2 [Ambispora leptoticha]|uniref:491_t:CDS:1 n=1 Tax=Ambispora leptoticha TaxID=144679 RepID=A0A9N8ZF23_9GLOM|nr:491_t:CDS:2 [Ambispora leptoticha]
MKRVIAIVLLISVLTLSPRSTFVNCSPVLTKKNGMFFGEATYYNTGLGACGKYNSDTDIVVAINKAQWGSTTNTNSNKICGKKITVNGPKGHVTVKVVDMCADCEYGSLDLSPSAFDKIASRSAGRVRISWKFS